MSKKAIMGRPFSSYVNMSRALELYAIGLGLTEVQQLISQGNGTPSIRTVSYWIARFKEVPASQLYLDRPFEWHNMESYQIPWEAIEFISGISSEDSSFSVRRGKWIWRIHLANPGLGDIQVRDLVSRCVVLEHMELLGIGGKLDEKWKLIWKALGGDNSKGDDSRRSLRLLEGVYAVCNVEVGMVLPEWVGGQGFVSIIRTQFGMSVVCRQDPIPSDEIDGISITGGWTCLRLPDGDVPKFGKIPFMVMTTVTGIYVLVKESDVTRLSDIVWKAGYRLREEQVVK